MSVTFPFSPLSVQDGAYTVDFLVNQPQRIAKNISDLAQVAMITPQLFSSTTATGGAILFDVVTKNDLFSTDLPGIIAPGGEYPIMDSDNPEPRVEKVKKTGGKFKITDEARKRNDISVLQRGASKVANTIVYEGDLAGMAALYEALERYKSDVITVQSTGWATAGTTKANDRIPAASIRADFVKAKAEGKKLKMGYTYDKLLVNPDDEAKFSLAFDDDQKAQALLGAQGLTLVAADTVTPGSALMVASGTVGVMGVEDALTTKTYRDDSIDSEWVQTHTTLAYGVTDPLAIIKIENIGA